MRKKQHHVRELTAEARRTPRRGRRKNLCELCASVVNNPHRTLLVAVSM